MRDRGRAPGSGIRRSLQGHTALGVVRRWLAALTIVCAALVAGGFGEPSNGALLGGAPALAAPGPTFTALIAERADASSDLGPLAARPRPVVRPAVVSPRELRLGRRPTP